MGTTKDIEEEQNWAEIQKLFPDFVKDFEDLQLHSDVNKEKVFNFVKKIYSFFSKKGDRFNRTTDKSISTSRYR